VKPGSLFPALHRLEEAGERQLGHETEEWQRIAAAMTHALKAT
jgi:hypothetical protein